MYEGLIAQLKLAEKVERGARWMDEYERGWADTPDPDDSNIAINLDDFDMRNGSKCVVGQLYGYWYPHARVVAAKIDPERAPVDIMDDWYDATPVLEEYGLTFDRRTVEAALSTWATPDLCYTDVNDELWDYLTEAWTREIKARRAKELVAA